MLDGLLIRGRICRKALRSVIAAAAGLVIVAIAGCGGSSSDDVERGAPASSEFPPSRGRTLGQIAGAADRGKLVVSPAGMVFDVGHNRFPFGVFTVGGEPVDDADVALYFARGLNGKARGPYPARVDSLQTKAAFRAQTTARDPDAATSVYVVPRIALNGPGEWTILAVVKEEDRLTATRLPSIVAGQFSNVPDVGERPPRIHTPTAADVGGDLSQIDTRIPPDSMHSADFADVLGDKPILLVFATPQLCQSRVCGPVVDIAEQVKAAFEDRAEFIHMEVYEKNDPNLGLRPQLRAFHLPTEPWAFVIDREGVITARFEGAFGVEELSRAMERVMR
jgi:hypothetical protein